MKKTIIISFFLATLPCAVAAYYLKQQNGQPTQPVLAAVLTLFLLLIPYFCLGMKDIQGFVRKRLESKPQTLFGLWLAYLVPYFVFAWGTDTFAWMSFAKLGAFTLLPALVLLGAQKQGRTPNFLDFMAIFVIWLPFDLGLLKDIWLWPKGEASYVINSILAVGFCVTLFVCFRKLAGIGYEFRVRRQDLMPIVLNFSIFCALALSFGIGTGFITYSGLDKLPLFVPAFIGIFVCIALPEELLFRGLLQNLVQQKWGRPLWSLAVASLIFGATHLNNGTHPDWRYFVLATIAGGFYGHTFQKTGNLTPAAIVHALVDTVWIIFFRT